MLINEELLHKYGAVTKNFQKSEYIFNEGDLQKSYYQILKGRVKLSHNNENGKEFIQTILTSGQSACELLLFINYNYPVSFVAIENSTILKLSKLNFEKLLHEHLKISRDINIFLQRAYIRSLLCFKIMRR
ncbi:Crp/Fnr family transcriptional regulator [Chryseobacterium indoltheticum]|uniref:Crp/Fnr family transcriptional regulator n=1 Tax=Chryseobacterium indoltheticum TaxID=254 RepID=UPI00191402E8|nr:cyclic nucleotide-binding domain-containing protein [Chryseobacterium indoltheticum]QQQ29028.1 cyclic nucleotide-binding domain-containing protein [Chryseobacterium indoltheticum]